MITALVTFSGSTFPLPITGTPLLWVLIPLPKAIVLEPYAVLPSPITFAPL